MLTFHGIPKRNSTALVANEDGSYRDKRIVHVLPMTDVISTPLPSPPCHEFAPPIRTQVVKVAFDDGSTRLGCVTLQDHEVGLSATVIEAL